LKPKIYVDGSTLVFIIEHGYTLTVGLQATERSLYSNMIVDQ